MIIDLSYVVKKNNADIYYIILQEILRHLNLSFRDYNISIPKRFSYWQRIDNDNTFIFEKHAREKRMYFDAMHLRVQSTLCMGGLK